MRRSTDSGNPALSLRKPVRTYAPVALLLLIGALLAVTVFIPYFGRGNETDAWAWLGVFLTYSALLALGIYLLTVLGVARKEQQTAVDNITALFSLNEHLKTIFRSINDGVITTDVDGHVTQMNRVAEQLTGWRQQNALGRDLREVFTLKGVEALADKNAFLQEILRSAGRTRAETEGVLISWGKVECPITYNFASLIDPQGMVMGAVVVLRDATAALDAARQRDRLIRELSETNDRLRAEITKSEQSRRAALNLMQDAQMAQVALSRSEEQLRSTNERLQESNQALEEYAHVASHDLQEPLRKIENFSAILLEEYGPRVDSKGRQYIDIMVGAAKRMRRLIKDVLALAEAGASERPLLPVDLNQVLATVKDNLSEYIKDRAAEMVVQHLPLVEGDETQLSRLFQNLISNGLKFNQNTSPRIEITAESGDDIWRITVRDNGIGMHPEEAAKLFVPFKRLHDRQSYEGTGIGLAVCRKIMSRHGGQIGVDSAPGAGSLFWMTFPKITSHV